MSTGHAPAGVTVVALMTWVVMPRLSGLLYADRS
jgi:hypothetical protein